MSVSAAFTPTGNTVVINAATSYPTAVQAPSNTGTSMQYRVINSSTTVGCFLSWGQTQTAAQDNCLVPNSNVSTAVIHVLPNTDEILTFAPNTWFTAITASSSCTLYIVPGDGM